LPKFYIDFENKDGRDGKRHALEVERLKMAKVTELCLMFVMMEEVRYRRLWISLDFSSSKAPLANQISRKKKRFYTIEIKN
jgi:hypothetical protein